MALSPKERLKLKIILASLKNKVYDACLESISETCENTYKYARARVPVDTGNLQSSLAMTPPAYHVGLGDNEIKAEVHFGEPGNIGGWYDQEAYTYMWTPGHDERNWHGAILYDGWRVVGSRLPSELKENIRKKLRR